MTPLTTSGEEQRRLKEGRFVALESAFIARVRRTRARRRPGATPVGTIADENASSSEAEKSSEAESAESDGEGTDCESEEERSEYATGLSGAETARPRRVLCAYEWEKNCSSCMEKRLAVLALRVEVLRRAREAKSDAQEERRVLCDVTGASEMKAFASRNGVEFGEVLSAGEIFLGRACPACGSGQGDYELFAALRMQSDEWLEAHRILEVGLPKRMAV